MANPLLIPEDSVKTRSVKRRPDIAANAFSIKRGQWDKKVPRLDIQVQKDGAPVYVKRIAIKSVDGLSEKFKLKYKVNPEDDDWKEWTELATGKMEV
jgi:hypothetical protein